MNNVPVIKAALLGAGTVGGGVCQILEWQKEEMPQKLGVSIELKKYWCVIQRKREKELTVRC